MPSNKKAWLYILFALFALSGFSGLIYESIWSHYLKLFLGHAAYAQNLVLAIFMGGMAAGAWLASRFMARLKSPLMGYVVVELLIGTFGLLFHGVFLRVTGFMLDDLLPGMQSPLAIDLARWSVAALLILPQTLLLGATFPLMSSGILRCFPNTPGSSISLLYFSNSMGAVLGVLASGFWLIGKVGLPGTIMTAALVNFLLALAVYIVSRKLEGASPLQAGVRNYRSDLLRPLLLVSMITGLSSFVYEIGWIRMLSLVLGASTHAFELMLSAFILGLALGGLWVRRRIDAFRDPQRVLGIVQLLMGLLALGTVISYNHVFDLMSAIMAALSRNDAGYVLFNLGSNLIALLVMLPVTFMAGMTLPLITYVLFREGEGESAIGKVYAANTLGAILGVWLTVQLLMPVFGLKATIIVGAVLDMALGAYLFLRTRAGARQLGLVLGGCLLITASVSLLVSFDNSKMISNVYRSGDVRLEAVSRFHADGKTATVDVYDVGDGERVIATNGKPDASVTMNSDEASSDEPTMVMIGALPLLVHPEAKTGAVIGMGSGISANVMLNSPHLERLDVIEIEPAMVEGARHFGRFSERVYKDPRSHIHIDDAKSFFAVHGKRYDLIVSEPSNPWVSGVSSLFSKEFYARINRHLNDDGILVQWFHLYENNDAIITSILSALSGEFGDYRIYAAMDSDYVLVASKVGRLPALSDSLYKVPSFRADMDRVGFYTLADVQLQEVGGRALLDPLFRANAVPANSDFFPYVDQNAVHARFMGNMAMQMQHIRMSGLPLPGSNFDGRLKTSERPPAQFSYAPRLQARQSQLIYRYLAEGGKAGLPPGVGSGMTSALVIALSAPACGDARGLSVWQENVAQLAMASTPYLSAAEMQLVVSRLREKLCVSEKNGAGGRFLDVMLAASSRDAAAMRTAATAFLGQGAVDDAVSSVYSLQVLLLGLTLSGEHRAVLENIARYQAGMTPVMQLFRAHALVGLAAAK